MLAILLILVIGTYNVKAQTEPPPDLWDNQMYFGNKVGWGGESWRHTAEFQTRYKNDVGSLEQWHVEYIASYLPSKNWELVPDYRITRKPDRVDHRFGGGVIFKSIMGKSILVQQVKYQYDVKGNNRNDSQGMRYALFYNYVFSEHWVGSLVSGVLYEWGDDFTGLLGYRGGPAMAYIINKQHSINFGYFYGYINGKQEPTQWYNAGIVSLQLIINISKDYKYIPAKYINF